MEQPKISVVMSVFNGEPYLSEAIESILNQTEINLEFIIINDGSSDGSTARLEHYQRIDSRIRLFHQCNRGLVESLNRGCADARANLIARMDADDVALPNRLRHQLEAMEADSTIGLLGAAAEFIDSHGHVIDTVRPPKTNAKLQNALLEGCVFLHPTTVFRRDVFLAVGGYRPVRHAEDYDLWLRMAERTRVANLNDVVLRYRIHRNQVSVRWCQAQALGATAARTSAIARRAGREDPLTEGTEITEALIDQLGVAANVVQSDLASTYLSCVRNLSRIGDWQGALDVLETLPLSMVARAKRWIITDLLLVKAHLQWRVGQLPQAVWSMARAVGNRPIVLFRPVWKLIKEEKFRGRLKCRADPT